jgi:LysM repeat protein
MVVLVFFIVLASLAGALLLATASRAADPAASPAPTVVVGPHDTLWSIAARTDRGRSPHNTVAEIRHLNGLDGYIVHPGETLIVPGTR